MRFSDPLRRLKHLANGGRLPDDEDLGAAKNDALIGTDHAAELLGIIRQRNGLWRYLSSSEYPAAASQASNTHAAKVCPFRFAART